MNEGSAEVERGVKQANQEVLVRYRLGLRRISYPLRAIARFAQMFGTLRPRPLVLSEVLNETIPLL